MTAFHVVGYSNSLEEKGQFSFSPSIRSISISKIILLCSAYFREAPSANGPFHLEVNGEHLFLVKWREHKYIVYDHPAESRLRKTPLSEEEFIQMLERFPLLDAPPSPPPERAIEKRSWNNGVTFVCSDEFMGRAEGEEAKYSISLNDHVISPEIFFKACQKMGKTFSRKYKMKPDFRDTAQDRYFRIKENGKVLGVFGEIRKEDGQLTYTITTMYYPTDTTLKGIFHFSSDVRYKEWLDKRATI